jgi:membrane protease YdiL (CAAX protease family)
MTITENQSTRTVQIPAWTRGRILRVWAAAALPMAALAWIVAPLLAHAWPGPAALPRAVILCLTAGLIWQFVLVAVIVRREQGTLAWLVVRDALWLRAPEQPRTGRRGGRFWLILLPCLLVFGAEEFVPEIPAAAGRDLPTFLQSEAGTSMLSGSWTWFAIIAVMAVFNTVLGEELLFRGLLLPRMRGAFGRGDWAVNGVLSALYHLHLPWAIPTALIDTVAIAYPSRRYRSALIGITVHSAQTVVILAGALAVVLR